MARTRSANIPQASSSRTQPDLFTSEQYLEDSALDNALSEEDEDLSSINLADQLSKMDSLPPSEIPPREGLYSTPLSWEQPQPGLRMDPLIGLNSVMTEAERRRLIAIAMSPGPSMGGLGSNINLGYGENDTGFGSTGWRPTPSRTSTSRTTPSAPQPKPAPQSKPAPTTAAKKKEDARAAHSNIERKYRDKLKDKIAELRDVVPSLQTISEAEGDGDGDSGGESLRPAKPKISKVSGSQNHLHCFHTIEEREEMLTERCAGNHPSESDGIHPPAREDKPRNEPSESGALETSPSLPAGLDSNDTSCLPSTRLQQISVRPERLLLSNFFLLSFLYHDIPPICIYTTQHQKVFSLAALHSEVCWHCDWALKM